MRPRSGLEPRSTSDALELAPGWGGRKIVSNRVSSSTRAHSATGKGNLGIHTSSASRARRARVLAAAAIAGAATVALAGSAAHAQVLYEPFDYGAGAVGTAFGNTSGTP